MNIFNNLLKKIIKLIKNASREELIYQLEGAINIELGNYIFDKNWMDWVNKGFPDKPQLNIYCHNTGGIDVYLVDNRYATVENDNLILNCEDKKFYELLDIFMIGHYHSDDLLWLTLNFEKEIRSMKNQINFYVKKNF